ncbi:MAG: RHS repeat-associated core domain-containing protein [Pirellulaceae bacterium]
MLATVTWAVDADGTWDVASNWKDDANVSRVPGPGDDVFLDRPTGVFTVTYGSTGSSTVRSLHAERNGFVLSAGSLNITAASELGGAFTFSGGNLDLDGPLTTAGTTTWTVGLLDGGTAGLINTGTLTLADSGLKRLSGNLVNAGTIIHGVTSSDLVNSNLGTVTNLADAVYEFQADKNVAIDTFINQGTLRKSDGAGTAIMSPRNFSNEGGTIDVQRGTLQISGPLNIMVGGLSTGGIFTVSAGALLDLTSLERTVRYSGTYTGSGAGTIRVRAGVLEVGEAGAAFNFPPRLLQWTGGIIAGGTAGLTNAGSISLAGSDVKFLSGVFNNAGTVTHMDSGNLQMGGFGVFFVGPEGSINNVASGVYDLRGDADFDVGVFNNFGTLRKSAGTGVCTSGFGHRFNNLGGTVDVRTGTVAIAGTTGVAPSHTGGTYLVAQGATLDLSTGAVNLRQFFTGIYTSSGDGLLRLNGGTVLAGPGGATFNFPAYQWSEGGIDGGPDGLTNAGVMTLASTSGMPLVNSLFNVGTIVHGSTAGDLGNGSFASPGSGILTNLAGAVYDFQVDKNVAIDTFINQGTLRKSDGAGTAIMSPRNFSNEGGTIDVQRGTLQISGPLNSMVGGLSSGGIFTVSAGAVLDLTGLERTVRYSGIYTGSGAGTIRVRAGVLQVGAGGAIFNFAPGLFQWTGGRISGGSAGLMNIGSVTLSGSDNKLLSGVFNNAGTVVHTGVGDLQLSALSPLPEGTFNNLASGLYDMQVSADFDFGVFNNFGTWRKSAGPEFSTTDRGHRFNNLGGTIDVRTGTFLLRGTTGAPYPTHTGGTFTVAADAFLDLDNGAGIQVFTGNYTGSGAGMVRIVGVVNTGKAITVGAGGAAFDFPPGLLHWTGGVIDALQAPLTNRGSMTVNVDPVNPFVRLRGILNNVGTLVHLGDGVISINGENGLGNLTNLAGGIYEFQGDGRIERNSAFGTGAAVHNFGTLRKVSGAGTATIDTDSPFDNAGTVEVNAGRFLVRSPVTQVNDTTLTGGTWKVGAGGLLELADYPRLTTNRATVVLDGPGSRFPALEQVITNTGSLALLGGRSLSVPVGRVARSFTTALPTYGMAFDPSVGNLLVYAGSATEIREYNPAGTEVVPRIPVPGGSALNLDLDVASESLTIGGTTVPAGTLLVVNGTAKMLFGIDRGSGEVLASVSLPVPFASVVGGSYHAVRNTLFLVDNFTVYEMDPADGALLASFPVQPTGSPPYSVSYGDLEVDPLTGNLLIVNGDRVAIRELTATGQFVRDQNIEALTVGRLAGVALDEATRHLWVCNTDGAVYDLESLFTNSGNLILSPGSTLDVPGAFIQDAGGTLTTRVGGNPASGQYGRVISTSPSTMGGTFGVELTGGFGPTTGQQYPIISYPSATGSFSQFAGLSGGRLPLFAVEQLTTGVVLNAVGSAADLMLERFVASTFPTTATPGQIVSITYDVRNLNETAAMGEWIDSLYLSRDTILDENDVLLGRVQHQGGVAGMSSYRETLTTPLPPLAEEPYRVILLSDSRGLVPEANRANNVGFSAATIAVTVPLLTLGTPVTETIANGQDRYYRLVAPAGKDFKITADFSATDVAEVYLLYGDVPDRSIYDQTTSANAQQQRLVIGSPQGGSYYILVHGREGAGAGSRFTLRAEATGFEIVQVTPLRGSNQGLVTIEVIGSQFTPQTTLSLRHDSGEVRTAQSVQFVDANRLRATFDLQGLAAGAFRVYADDPGAPGPAIALDTFTVTDEPSGIVSLAILSPAFVRVGSPIGVSITIINGNDSPAVAPILEVVATNVADGQERQVALGTGLDALPGELPPLYEGDVGITYSPKPKANGVVSTFDLVVLNPSATLIDWDSQKGSLRPPTIPADAWDAIWANLRPVLGNTLADLYALLQNDARQLAVLGHNINSVSRLFQFELRKANDLPAVPVPASAVDLAFPAPGVPLLFARDFGASIAQRFHVGRLGRGWVDNFDISLTNDASTGVVMVQQGFSLRPFAKQADGTYGGLRGDFGTLIEVGRGFQLREKTGEVIGFRADGLLDFLEDPNGNRITARYTSNQLTSLTHSNGSVVTLEYNAQGRISQITDPVGRVAAYVYDASGQHLQRVTTTEGTTEYTYTSDTSGPRAHALTSIGFPAGTHFFFDYDSQGRLARQQRDGGVEPLTFVYSVASYRMKDALDNVTIVSYDDLGLIKDTWDGLSRRTVFSHSISQNLLTRITGPDGLTSTFNYDPRGNPIQSINPLGLEQQFEYEPTFNSLVGWHDALGHSTGFSVDAKGNLLSTTYPDGTIEEVGHDPQGNLVRAVNRRGLTVLYTYDVNGLVRTKELPSGVRIEYVYDARGNLLSATGPAGATVMEYDAADRMTKITYPGGRFLEFSYDAGGRRIQSTDQSGFSVHYRYDAPGRLEELTDGGGQRLVLYQYDPAGRLVSEIRGNGTTTSYEYDAADQLLHLVHRAPDTTILSRFDYTYDDNGRRTSMTTLEGTTEYRYDAAGQLILVALPEGRIIEYEYDEAGNRRAVHDNGATTTYTVNAMNQYLAVGTTSQSFDADGNLVASASSSGPENYTYDAEGRLVTVVTPQGTWNYEYDVFGNRVATIHNGQRTEYLIDPVGLGDVVAEYDNSGNLRAHYTHGLGLVSRMDVSGPPAYFQFDAVGNTSQLTGPVGAVLNSYSYLPFGEPLSRSETVPTPFTFGAQVGVMRESNGLDYMRGRWYDPPLGRFTQQDPIGLAGGLNYYTYANNNPLTFVDPSGLVGKNFHFGPGGRGSIPSGKPGGGSYTYTPSGPTGKFGDAYAREVAKENALRQAELKAERELGKRAAQLAERKLAEQTLKAEAPTAALAFVAVAGAAIGHAGYYAAFYAITGDTPYCTPFVPDDLLQTFEPYCRPAELPFGLHAGLTSTQQRQPSKDPNDISGPAGFGESHFLADRPILPYTILFENIPDALGPAAQVVVTHQLDDDLDLDTFQLGDFGFGDLIVDVPDGRQFYNTRIDLRATRGVLVDATAELDHPSRFVSWTLTALDPATMDIPIDPFIGFLPPDKVPPEGQGFVNYSIRPKAGSPTGTRIDAQARIVFDTNDPIDTPLWFNTVDAGAPASSVAPLPAASPTSFLVSWSGSDDADGVPGSGIATFDVFVSDNGGPFTVWQQNTSQTSATFVGQREHTYAFYTTAVDNVGHREAIPLTADTQTRVTDNRAPVADDDVVNATENLAIIIDTLSNDTDTDGDPLSARIVDGPSHGSLTPNADGTFTYLPDLNFNREDMFRYVADDGTIDSNIATVMITVGTSFPWHNGWTPLNVNDDASRAITPNDALLVINELNLNGSHRLPTDRPRPLTKPFVDVNRDGKVSPLDALLVINYLNLDEGGEGESAQVTTSERTITTWSPTGASAGTSKPGAANGDDEDRADETRVRDSSRSSRFLQSLDLLFAKLDETQPFATREPAAGRRDVHAEDLEAFLDSMLKGTLNEGELISATAR